MTTGDPMVTGDPPFSRPRHRHGEEFAFGTWRIARQRLARRLPRDQNSGDVMTRSSLSSNGFIYIYIIMYNYIHTDI